MRKSKVAMVVAPKEFRDEEYSEPRRILTEGGCEVKVVSSGVRPCRGRFGLEAPVDLQIEELKAKDFDAVILVGGPGAMQFFRDIVLHQILRDFAAEGKIIGAICIAPTILGNAGLLKGKSVTAYSSEHKYLQSVGARVNAKDAVVIDGSLITANGPEAAPAFGKAMLEAVEAYRAAHPEEEENPEPTEEKPF